MEVRKTVLSNDTEVSESRVKHAMAALQDVKNRFPFAVSCLAEYCQDAKNTIPEVYKRHLKEAGLMDEDVVPEDVKNIVLCAVKIETLNIKIEDPTVKSLSTLFTSKKTAIAALSVFAVTATAFIADAICKNYPRIIPK